MQMFVRIFSVLLLILQTSAYSQFSFSFEDSDTVPKDDSLKLLLVPGGIVGMDTWNDSSGFNRNFAAGYNNAPGTLNGYTTSNFNSSGGARSYVGSSNNFDHNNTTFFAVVKATAGRPYQVIIGSEGSSPTHSKLIRFGVNTSNQFEAWTRDGNDNVISATSDSVITGQWVVIAATVDADNKAVSVYVKGLISSSKNTAYISSTTFNNGSGAGIGQVVYSSVPSWQYDGQMAELRLYRGVKSLTEINSIGLSIAARYNLTWAQVTPKIYATYVNTDATIGYSFRQVNPNYSGALVRLRRGSDNVEKDFYTSAYPQDSLLVDTSAIKSWGGNATLYGVKWYDQMGTNNHLTMTINNAKQPVYCKDSLNGKPGWFFNNLNYFLATDKTPFNALTTFSIMIVDRESKANDFNTLVNKGNNNYSSYNGWCTMGGQIVGFQPSVSTAATNLINLSYRMKGHSETYIVTGSNAKSYAYLDLAGNPITNFANAQNTSDLMVGAYYNDMAGWTSGNFYGIASEILIWNSDISGTRKVKQLDSYKFWRMSFPYDSTYQFETNNFMAALSTQLNKSTYDTLNQFVVMMKDSLQTDTLAKRFDTMYHLWLPTSEASLKNFINPAFANATAVNTPTYTAYKGYAGGGTKYINTNYTPSSSKKVFSQNNCSMSIWVNTSGVTGDYTDMGVWSDTYSQETSIYSRTASGNTSVQINGSGFSLANANSYGYYEVVRDRSDTTRMIKNGSYFSNSGTSKSPADRPLTILALNSSTPAGYSPRQISYATIGNTRTEAEAKREYNIVTWLKTKIGW